MQVLISNQMYSFIRIVTILKNFFQVYSCKERRMAWLRAAILNHKRFTELMISNLPIYKTKMLSIILNYCFIKDDESTLKIGIISGKFLVSLNIN